MNIWPWIISAVFTLVVVLAIKKKAGKEPDFGGAKVGRSMCHLPQSIKEYSKQQATHYLDVAESMGMSVTVSGYGANKSGDLIVRKKRDNKEPPFWGTNQSTGKRGRAVRLYEFKPVDLKGEISGKE